MELKHNVMGVVPVVSQVVNERKGARKTNIKSKLCEQTVMRCKRKADSKIYEIWLIVRI